MSDAVAKLKVDATDATRGAEEFARAAQIIFNSDKKTKDQVGKSSRRSGGKPKEAEGIGGITKEILKAKDGAGVFDLITSKLKGVNLATLGAAVTMGGLYKSIRDAGNESIKFDELMRRFDKGNRGNAANRSESELTGQFNEAKAELEAMKKAQADRASSPWGVNVLKGAVHPAQEWLKEHFSRTGSEIAKSIGGEGWETYTEEEKKQKLQEATEKLAERIAQKEKAIFDIIEKRNRGDKEGAEIDAVRLEYAEKIHNAINPGGTPNEALQKQLKAEENALVSYIEKRKAASSFDRLTQRADAANRVGNARRALGMSDEEVQRSDNLTRAAEAGAGVDVAKKNLEAAPDSPELQNAVSMADRAHQQVLAENFKWERDIARTKGDQTKTINAQIEAEKLRSQGRNAEAQQLEARVQAEIAIAQAVRGGNTDLKERLTIQQALNIKVSDYNKLIDPETGKLKPASDRQKDRQKDRRRKRNIKNSQARIDENEGLDRVERDSSGNVVSGIDPDTGDRVTVEERKKRKLAQQSKGAPMSPERYNALRETIDNNPEAATKEERAQVQQYEDFISRGGEGASSQAPDYNQAARQVFGGSSVQPATKTGGSTVAMPAVIGSGIRDKSKNRAGQRVTMKGMPTSEAMDSRITLDTRGGAAVVLPQTSANNSTVAAQEAAQTAENAQAQGAIIGAHYENASRTAKNTETTASATTKASGSDGAAGVLLDIKALLQQWSQ